jgi:hypothetical protein
MKAYIVWFESRESANGEIIDYQFSSSPTDAMSWSVRQFAGADIRHFNRGITINEDVGHPHRLTNFEIEEREPGKFVVFAEGPFVERTRGEGGGQSKAQMR